MKKRFLRSVSNLINGVVPLELNASLFAKNEKLSNEERIAGIEFLEERLSGLKQELHQELLVETEKELHEISETIRLEKFKVEKTLYFDLKNRGGSGA